MKEHFRKFAHDVAKLSGTPGAFCTALGTIVIWGLLGPHFHFSDTWQLVINTGTTIITFLMVFLIQNSQNRDGRAVQLKLDELIRANKNARNQLIDLEDLEEAELDKVHQELCELNMHTEARIEAIQEKKNKRHHKHHR